MSFRFSPRWSLVVMLATLLGVRTTQAEDTWGVAVGQLQSFVTNAQAVDPVTAVKVLPQWEAMTNSMLQVKSVLDATIRQSVRFAKELKTKADDLVDSNPDEASRYSGMRDEVMRQLDDLETLKMRLNSSISQLVARIGQVRAEAQPQGR